jgi:hypothetical protein
MLPPLATLESEQWALPPLMRVQLAHPLQGTVEGAVAAPDEGRGTLGLLGTVEGAVAAPGEGTVDPLYRVQLRALWPPLVRV